MDKETVNPEDGFCVRFLKCLGSASSSKKIANFMMKSETESLRFFNLWGN